MEAFQWPSQTAQLHSRIGYAVDVGSNHDSHTFMTLMPEKDKVAFAEQLEMTKICFKKTEPNWAITKTGIMGHYCVNNT